MSENLHVITLDIICNPNFVKIVYTVTCKHHFVNCAMKHFSYAFHMGQQAIRSAHTNLEHIQA